LGLAKEEIAVKTAEINDLRNLENQNLLSPGNRIRVIITKQALQEGWNCPFAYVICALAATSNMSAMTQLIGRILRQPGAIKTEVPELDQCYIITHRAETADVIGKVRQSLETEGPPPLRSSNNIKLNTCSGKYGPRFLQDSWWYRSLCQSLGP